jgi:transcriptional regulator with XRE-family HTH domain
LSKRRKPLKERVDQLKARKDRRYFELRLRDDVSQLIYDGLARAGITQAELAKQSGLWESQISRLLHAETSPKIGTLAQVLVPLGITPTILDKAEVDRLRNLEKPATVTDWSDSNEREAVIGSLTVSAFSARDRIPRVIARPPGPLRQARPSDRLGRSREGFIKAHAGDEPGVGSDVVVLSRT